MLTQGKPINRCGKAMLFLAEYDAHMQWAKKQKHLLGSDGAARVEKRRVLERFVQYKFKYKHNGHINRNIQKYMNMYKHTHIQHIHIENLRQPSKNAHEQT